RRRTEQLGDQRAENAAVRDHDRRVIGVAGRQPGECASNACVKLAEPLTAGPMEVRIEILELRGERWLGLDQFGPGPTLIGAEMQFGNLWFDLDRQTKQGRYGTGGVACALERAGHDDIGTNVAVDVGGDSGGLLDPVLIERDIGT